MYNKLEKFRKVFDNVPLHFNSYYQQGERQIYLFSWNVSFVCSQENQICLFSWNVRFVSWFILQCLECLVLEWRYDIETIL